MISHISALHALFVSAYMHGCRSMSRFVSFTLRDEECQKHPGGLCPCRMYKHVSLHLAVCTLWQNVQHSCSCMALVACFCLLNQQFNLYAWTVSAESCLAQQAQEQLLLQLRDHLETNPVLTASHQRLQTKLRQETCMGPRLALNPPVLDILKAIPATTCIISLHLSSEHGSVLYCAVLRGQQAGDTGPAGKTKAAKQGRQYTPQSVLPCMPKGHRLNLCKSVRWTVSSSVMSWHVNDHRLNLCKSLRDVYS